MNKKELLANLERKFEVVDSENIYQGKTEAGVTIFGVSVFEKKNNVMRKLNLTFYTKGEEAFYGNNEPNATIVPPPIRFQDKVNTYIKTKIEDETIRFGTILSVNEQVKKALVDVIMPALLIGTKHKKAIISEVAGVMTVQVIKND